MAHHTPPGDFSSLFREVQFHQGMIFIRETEQSMIGSVFHADNWQSLLPDYLPVRDAEFSTKLFLNL